MAVDQGSVLTAPRGADAGTRAETPTAFGASASRRWLGRVERDAVYRRALVLADALAAVAAVLISIAAIPRFHISLWALGTVPLIVVMSKLSGTYDREDLLVRKSSLDEVPQLFQLATLYALTAWILDRLLITRTAAAQALVVLWLVLFGSLILFRALARAFARTVTLPERCLVLGGSEECDSLRAKFARRRSLHAVVIGQLTPEELSLTRAVSTAGALREAIEWHGWAPGVDRLILTSDIADSQGFTALVREATTLGMKVSVLPRFLEAVGSSAQFDDLEGLPLLSIRPLSLSRSSQALKRTVDLSVSTVALLASAPLMALIAAAIRLDSSGPILFRQLRIGKDGESFPLFKFRTMIPDADERKAELSHLNEADGGLFKIAEDPRITRIGRWLRRTSLDELPQLLNVLRGEMSLVGPRPLVAEEDQRIEGWHRRRLHLTPGMTGHWQVLGSARIPLDEMVRIDYLYVTNWSLWLDVKIVLRTVPYVLFGNGQ
jgi:exopolysaccharide biosynthesis polyprenyl glycosylphosphotransferase